MPNESKTPEEYLSDALDLMVKAKWVKQYGPSAKGFGVDWTDRGKLAMEALGYVIADLGPENFNQQLWWAVGTLANITFYHSLKSRACSCVAITLPASS